MTVYLFTGHVLAKGNYQKFQGYLDTSHTFNPSGRTMALGLTQPLTEMSTRNISWG